MIYKIIAVIWLICSIIDYKVCLADLQSFGTDKSVSDRLYDKFCDRLCALAFSLCGPFGLIVILLDRSRKRFKS